MGAWRGARLQRLPRAAQSLGGGVAGVRLSEKESPLRGFCYTSLMMMVVIAATADTNVAAIATGYHRDSWLIFADSAISFAISASTFLSSACFISISNLFIWFPFLVARACFVLPYDLYYTRYFRVVKHFLQLFQTFLQHYPFSVRHAAVVFGVCIGLPILYRA